MLGNGTMSPNSFRFPARAKVPNMVTPDWGTSYFRDCVDPDDRNFRLVKLRLPHDPMGQPNYGPFEYLGVAARERIRRFAAALLQGTGDISARDAARIINKSRAVDERRA